MCFITIGYAQNVIVTVMASDGFVNIVCILSCIVLMSNDVILTYINAIVIDGIISGIIGANFIAFVNPVYVNDVYFGLSV